MVSSFLQRFSAVPNPSRIIEPLDKVSDYLQDLSLDDLGYAASTGGGVLSQAVRDTVGTLSSGETALNRFIPNPRAFTDDNAEPYLPLGTMGREQLSRIPGIGNALGDATDVMLAPGNAALATRGLSSVLNAGSRVIPAAIRATRPARFVGRAAQSIAEPLASNPWRAYVAESVSAGTFTGLESAMNDLGASGWVSYPVGLLGAVLSARRLTAGDLDQALSSAASRARNMDDFNLSQSLDRSADYDGQLVPLDVIQRYHRTQGEDSFSSEGREIFDFVQQLQPRYSSVTREQLAKGNFPSPIRRAIPFMNAGDQAKLDYWRHLYDDGEAFRRFLLEEVSNDGESVILFRHETKEEMINNIRITYSWRYPRSLEYPANLYGDIYGGVQPHSYDPTAGPMQYGLPRVSGPRESYPMEDARLIIMRRVPIEEVLVANPWYPGEREVLVLDPSSFTRDAWRGLTGQESVSPYIGMNAKLPTAGDLTPPRRPAFGGANYPDPSEFLNTKLPTPSEKLANYINGIADDEATEGLLKHIATQAQFYEIPSGEGLDYSRLLKPDDFARWAALPNSIKVEFHNLLDVALKAKKYPTLYTGALESSKPSVPFSPPFSGDVFSNPSTYDSFLNELDDALVDYTDMNVKYNIQSYLEKQILGQYDVITEAETAAINTLKGADLNAVTQIGLKYALEANKTSAPTAGIMEGEFANAASAIQSREQLRNEDKRNQIRDQIGRLSPRELFREGIEYGIILGDDIEATLDELSGAIASDPGRRNLIQNVYAEFEEGFMQLPLDSLKVHALGENLRITGTKRELVTRIIDGYISRSGIDVNSVQVPNPARATFHKISLDELPHVRLNQADSIQEQLDRVELPESLRIQLDSLKSIPASSERFANTGLLGGPDGPFGAVGADTPLTGPTLPGNRVSDRQDPLGGPSGPFGARGAGPDGGLGGSGSVPPGGFSDEGFSQGNFEGIPPNKEASLRDYPRLINQSLKAIWANFDMSWFGINGPLTYARILTAGGPERLGTNFNTVTSTINASFRGMFNDEFLKDFLTGRDRKWADIDPRMTSQWIMQHGGVLASVSRDADVVIEEGLLERVPGMAASNRLYVNAGDFSRLSLIETEWAVRGGNALSDEQLIQIIRASNRTTGFGNRNIFGSSSDLFLFAPRFFASQLETVTKAFLDGGIEGDMARKSLLAYLGIAGTITFGINAARGEYEHDMWNPYSSNFFRIKDVAGHDVSLLGPWDSLIRGIARTAEDPKEGLEFFVRSKSSPIISTAWDLFSGKNFMGEDITPQSFVLGLFTSFSMRDVSKDPLPITALNLIGVKSSPQTPTEFLEAAMERDGVSPEDPLARRQWLAAHPDFMPQATRDDAIYRDAVRTDIKQRAALNDERLLTGQISLVDWRENRRILLRENRNKMEILTKDLQDRAPKNQQELWVKTYMELFNQSADPITGDVVSEEFDKLLLEWLNTYGQPAYEYMQEFNLVGKSPVELAYLNDMNTLRELGYFDMPRLQGMTSGATDEEILTLRDQVSAARALDPRLAQMEFANAALYVLKDVPFSVRRDVANSYRESFQNPQISRLRDRYPQLFLWFNDSMYYEQYSQVSGTSTNVESMLTLQQRQLLVQRIEEGSPIIRR